jgi:signal transduction histidine kinase
MKLKKILFVLLVATSLGLASHAKADATHGSKEEAQAMCEKAAALVKSDGAEKAFAKFQAKDGGFNDRDLYVFVVDDKGTFVAHGAKPALVGKVSIDLKDPTGFPLVQKFIEVQDKGWVDYKWPDSSDNNKIKDKSSYIIHVGTYWVGVGYYKV